MSDGDTPQVVDIKALRARDGGSVLDRVIELRQQTDAMFIEIGALLHRIYEEELWKAWQNGSGADFESWSDFVESQMGFSRRKGEMLRKVWYWYVIKHTEATDKDAFEAGEFDTSLLDRLAHHGSTKLYYGTNIVTAENVDEWDTLMENNSTRDFQILAGKHVEDGEKPSGAADGQESQPAKNMVFGLFPGQRETVDQALARAAAITESNKKGHNITAVCADFLATNATDGGVSLDTIIRALELGRNIKIVAFSKGDLVYGLETLNAQATKAKTKAKPDKTAG